MKPVFGGQEIYESCHLFMYLVVADLLIKTMISQSGNCFVSETDL